mgnify:CR=1 FL=1
MYIYICTCALRSAHAYHACSSTSDGQVWATPGIITHTSVAAMSALVLPSSAVANSAGTAVGCVCDATDRQLCMCCCRRSAGTQGAGVAPEDQVSCCTVLPEDPCCTRFQGGRSVCAAQHNSLRHRRTRCVLGPAAATLLMGVIGC